MSKSAQDPNHVATSALSTADLSTAEIRIEDSGGTPHLYTGDVGPGSKVIFMVDNNLDSVTVSFNPKSGEVPLVGCPESFRIGSGAPVEFEVASVEPGTYDFEVQKAGHPTLSARLVVGGPDVPKLAKTGFVIRPRGSALLSYQNLNASLGAPVPDMLIHVSCAESLSSNPPSMVVRRPDGTSQTLEQENCAVPVDGFGRVATVALVSSKGADKEGSPPGHGQTGGTEQVEVVVEPEGGG